MEISIEQAGGLCRVRVEGEMTIYTAAETRDRFVAALGAGDSVEIDLSGVSEIDAAGLQLLAMVKREAALGAMHLAFVAHSEAVLEMLDLCDLASVFGDPVVISSQAD